MTPTYEPLQENLDLPVVKRDLLNLVTKSEIEPLKTNVQNITLELHDIKEDIAALPSKEDLSQLLTSVDKLVGQVETYNKERAAEGHRLEQIEGWIKKAASAINIPIEF